MKRGGKRSETFHFWTAEDDARLTAMATANCTTDAIASELGVSSHAVAHRRRKLGLPKPKVWRGNDGNPRRWTPEDLADEDAQRRFIGKISFDGDGCWRWGGYRDKSGYGNFSFMCQTAYAHRMSYEFFVEPVPDGLVLDHLCRNPACINPDHLEPVTTRTNIMRGVLPEVNKRRAKTWAA